jgi:hypothetical protein
MIRANLLPRRRETLNVLSFELEFDLLKEIGLALAIVLIVTLIGVQIERLRIDRLSSAADDLEARVAANAPQRETTRRLMLEVAHYQEFEREEGTYRRSGALAALAIARIGNSVPQNVWVDEISHVDNGYAIEGGAHSVDSLAGAIASLGSAEPSDRASLVNVTNTDHSGSGVHFSARLMPPVAPSSAPAASAAQPAAGAAAPLLPRTVAR